MKQVFKIETPVFEQGDMLSKTLTKLMLLYTHQNTKRDKFSLP